MRTNEEITNEIHRIASDFSSEKKTPYLAILQPRRDYAEIAAQNIDDEVHRMVIVTASVVYYSVDGKPVDVARCILMDRAIEDNPKYSLFVDEDTALPEYGLMNLIMTGQKYPDAIIVGVYYQKRAGALIGMIDEEGRYVQGDVTPNTGLIRNVSFSGLGCALIPMSAIHKIKKAYPDIPLFCNIPNGTWGDSNIKFMGEDMWFCHLVKKCGIEIIADTSVHCLHIELSTGKYTAHPDVVLSDYITRMSIAEKLTYGDRFRVSKDYINRMQTAQYLTGIDTPIKELPVKYTNDTLSKIRSCIKQVQSTQNAYEIAMLCEKLKELQPQTILEIGMGTGGSMNIWGEFAAPDAFLVGVDTDKQVTETYVHNNREQKLTFVIGDSTFPMTLGMVKQTLGNRKVDFLFIDGAHDETVRYDYETYSPLVREGGIIAFHDIDVNHLEKECTSIKKLWSEMKEKYSNTDEFINTEAEYRYGIGVIYV